MQDLALRAYMYKVWAPSLSAASESFCQVTEGAFHGSADCNDGRIVLYGVKGSQGSY